MDGKTAAIVLGGGAAVAALAGVTYAFLQPPAPNPPAVVTSASPNPSPQETPVSPPVASPPGSAKPAQSLTASPTVPKPEATTQPAGESAQPIRKVESCVVKMALVDSPSPPANVRSAPQVAAGNVVGQVKNGTFLAVTDVQGDWFKISTPTSGWISKGQTQSGCNQKVEQVSFAPNTDKFTISDRFIGAGTHRYRLNLGKGQTMTLQATKGPLPLLMGPEGKTIGGGDMHSDKTTWTGELPVTGDYTIQLESNYKGYKYAFQVQVK